MQEVRGHLAAPTVCKHMVSGSFHSPLGVLFTFPSRYSFTIGHQVVLSLGRWSSQLPPGFLVPQGTQVSTSESKTFRLRGSHPLRRSFPAASTMSSLSYSASAYSSEHVDPTTPQQQRLYAYTAVVWALPLSLATTQGVSFDFLSCRY